LKSVNSKFSVYTTTTTTAHVQQCSLHAGFHSQRARTLTTALCAAAGNSLLLLVGMSPQKFDSGADSEGIYIKYPTCLL